MFSAVVLQQEREPLAAVIPGDLVSISVSTKTVASPVFKECYGEGMSQTPRMNNPENRQSRFKRHFRSTFQTAQTENSE